jgi:hypothetical protein
MLKKDRNLSPTSFLQFPHELTPLEAEYRFEG